jgi:nucleoid DNA-binding protein
MRKAVKPLEELYREVAKSTGQTHPAIRAVVRALAAHRRVCRYRRDGAVIWIRRLQSIEARRTTWQNMQTGEPMIVPPRRLVHFKASKALVERVRGDGE